jgi:CRISPR-associated protein Csm1
MIVLGDISGIQNYLFDVADAGGGQARRLRARSFYIQLMAEAAALQTLRALGWPRDEHHFISSVAGKFLLRGPDDSSANAKLCALQQRFSEWLLAKMRGELRLALGWAEEDRAEAAAYRTAMAALQTSKLRAWAPFAGTGWDPARLVLAPLDRPCSLCGHEKATEEDRDEETGAVRPICARCANDYNIGKILPGARWLIFSEEPCAADLDLLGITARVSAAEHPEIGAGTLALANLTHPDRRPDWCPPDFFHRRRLMAYIPLTANQPMWFVDIAGRARGDRLLGVLKADVDSLGAALNALLESSGDLREMASFSSRLDAFFGERVKQEMESGADPRRRFIYTVFAGGDDLLLVGPWDVMFDFAGRVRELFKEEFGGMNLTLSAGLALIKPKRPLKSAAAEAERLLEQAKTIPPPLSTVSKDACAALGQEWKWEHHQVVLDTAKQLADWVEQRECKRGWLHTLLELAEIRNGDRKPDSQPAALATARLSYHVRRNYPQHSQIRRWGEDLVGRFDNLQDPQIRFLPAALRYALTATRAPEEEEQHVRTQPLQVAAGRIHCPTRQS